MVGLSEPAYTSPKDYKLELSNNEKVLVRKDKEPIKISFTQNLPILKGIYVRSEIKPGKSNSTIREEKIKREKAARLRALQTKRMEYARNKSTVSTPGVSNGRNDWTANISLGHNLCIARFGEGHWLSLYALWMRESGWSSTILNRSGSGAAGIAQNIDGWSTNYSYGDAREQILWGLNYIAQRYGNPTNANTFQLRIGWY